VCAKAGIDVVLKDVSVEAAAKGKGYSEKLVTKAVSRGKMTQDKADALLARITPTADAAAAAGADLVIEAVFESPELKKKVFAEIEPHVAPDAVLGSNTSTLPITGLAEGVSRPADFIGLHFFSPVDKMPLLEIVVGENTSDAALARAIDFALQIGKVPIVVSDAYGFYANRVIAQFVDQALALVLEGAHPASVEQAATQAGFPVGALTLLDELNLTTLQKVLLGFAETARADGQVVHGQSRYDLVDRMVEVHDRAGRIFGKGFYEYAEDGSRQRLWPPFVAEYHKPEVHIPFRDMQERMLVAAS
jgi:3-hydroxyacyl-CoA dehydrogenase/enoyl-CoA hydratase/3-hydroxybutyryl-CoA epimerase